MSTSSGQPAEESVTPLTLEAFTAMAERLKVDADVHEELYPMVRDLLVFAGKLNALAPELDQEIDIAQLSTGGLK